MKPARIALALAASLPALAAAQTPLPAEAQWDTFADTWVATDQLGRAVAGEGVAPAPRDRTVGMFYFLWLNEHTNTGPHNITEILAANPTNPQWGPLNHFHHWEESVFGYYRSSDAWVMRRHVAMLANAGVDVLIVDGTNGFDYRANYMALLSVMADMRADGQRTPELAFFARDTSANKVFQELYLSGEKSWIPQKHIPRAGVEGGTLRLEVSGNDPILHSKDNLGISATSYTSFSFTMKRPAGGSPAAQLFWRRDSDTGFAQARSAVVALPPGGGFETSTINLSGHPEWTGTIRQLRFDPLNGLEGAVEIDTITLGGIVPRAWTFEGADHHPDLWSWWEGKPLLLPVSVAPDPSAAALAFFRSKPTWGLQRLTEPDHWSFIQHYPQDVSFSSLAPGVPEFMVVSIAQQETYISYPTAHGRHYHDGAQPPSSTWDGSGKNFGEQWARALATDPKFVFVTGWNEWVAQRFEDDQGNSRFVDAYSDEYSRDIEPIRDRHADNYYYQLVDNVRRFKGVRPRPANVVAPIAIDGEFADWDAVEPEYRDTLGDADHRNHPGWGSSLVYVNETGLNDIKSAKVSADATTLHILLGAAAPLQGLLGQQNVLTVLVDADQDVSTGWLGYDYAINRTARGIERHAGGGWNWTPVQEGLVAQRAAAGDSMELAVPLAALGLGSYPLAFDFKVVDKITGNGEWWDLTVNGDAAPDDRFNYRVQIDAPAPSGPGNGWVLE